jgi:hypothetical protein
MAPRVRGGEATFYNLPGTAAFFREAASPNKPFQYYRERVGIDALTDDEIVPFRVGHDRPFQLGCRLLTTAREFP